MSKIPTAEEFFEQDGTYPELAIQFAKLHVKAALEAAAENAVAKENPNDFGTGEIWVDSKSILNAYLLTLIK